MMPEIFDYKLSFLNPLLKLLAPVLFAIATYYFYRARNQYQGELGKVVHRLAAACFTGLLANFFRYGADLWFTDLKWGESIFFLLFALVSVYAIWPLLIFIRQMSAMNKSVK